MFRCSLCSHARPIVRPHFPETSSSPQARVALLGEGPSYEEDKQGMPFVGKTGFELTNTYLPVLGIPRSHLAITNARLCSAKNYDNPTPEQALSCSGLHLSSFLEQVKPEVLVPMGAVACSLWLEIDLNLDHGLPMVGKWGSWEGVLWPSYHPAAGIHQTGFMIALMQDFENLRKFLRGADKA